jgi:ribosomal protein L7/L12
MEGLGTTMSSLLPIIVIVGIILIGLGLVIRGNAKASDVSSNIPPVSLDPQAVASDPEFLDHLQNDRKINAIKRYRELTGVGLKEAKDSVEYFEAHPEALVDIVDKRTNRLSVEGGSGTPFDAGIRELIKQNKSHEAIKVYQDFTGASLSEAAIEIERLTWEIEEQDKRSSGGTE